MFQPFISMLDNIYAIIKKSLCEAILDSKNYVRMIRHFFDKNHLERFHFE